MTDRSTIDEERGFDADLYFYSRTDPRGVIRSGNTTFFDVSGFTPEELVGAPHRLVRHPDMPRGVFWLMWQRLQAGAPMVAYVKNRTKCGRYYWVFAIVAPIEGGYVSIRMKPLATEFSAVASVYAALREAEAQGASPEDSAALLDALLVERGHDSFAGFSSRAVTAELRARSSASMVHQISTVDGLGGLGKAIDRLAGEQDRLLETFKALSLVPTNMRILASRLEPSGGPISAISDSYKRATAEITSVITAMTGADGQACSRMIDAVHAAATGVASASLVGLAGTQFKREGLAADENAVFSGVVSAAQTHARIEVDAVGVAVRKLRKNGEALQRLMSGLDQIRILGEVESGRNRNVDSGLSSIMEQLEQFHHAIHGRLDEIINLSARMRTTADRLAA